VARRYSIVHATPELLSADDFLFTAFDTLHRRIRRSDVVKVFEMLFDHFENIGIRRRAGLGGVLGDQPMNFIRHFNGDALVHRTILNQPIYNSSP